jgi:uncharacterized protein Veg
MSTQNNYVQDLLRIPATADDEIIRRKDLVSGGTGNLTKFTYKITSTMTDGVENVFTITHNLHDVYPSVFVIDATTKKDILVEIDRPDEDTVIITFMDPVSITGQEFIVHILGEVNAVYPSLP